MNVQGVLKDFERSVCVGVVRKGMIMKIQNLKTTGWDPETLMPPTVLAHLYYTSLPDGASTALGSLPHTPRVMLSISSQKQIINLESRKSCRLKGADSKLPSVFMGSF